VTGAAPGRIHAFDWLRGVAVVVMIQTHSLVLLQPALEKEKLFSWLVRIDGLVAPSFIFSAGFALALVQVRAAISAAKKPALEAITARKAQALKTLKRIGEVLLVASIVNTVWFATWRELKWFLRIDILHCIGISLLAVLPLLVALASRPNVLRWLMLGLAALVFGAAPLMETVEGPLSILVNTKVGAIDDTLGTTFPLFPWAGYVFLGASFGATVGRMKREAELWAWLGLLWGVGAVLWWHDAFFRDLYPPHNFWATNPANAAQRWTWVLSLVAIFRVVETKVAFATTSKAAALLGTFGAASLSGYFFHEMLLYQRHVGVFTKLFRGKLDFVTYWPVLALLVFATWLCVKAWDRLDPKVRALLSRRAPPRPAA
jgi:uncharacterized membrane protein